MSLNQSMQGTQHIRAIADKVLLSEDGVTVVLDTRNDAIRLRMQFNNLRVQDRKFSKKLYKFDDARYGTSNYDSIETRIVERAGKYHLVFRTVLATLSHMQIIDNKTNEPIKVEDL